MWLSRQRTRLPYLADNAEQARPPIPDPMTMMSYSPSSPDIPFPVPGYVGFSYAGSIDISYEKVMTLSREVSSVWATLVLPLTGASVFSTVDASGDVRGARGAGTKAEAVAAERMKAARVHFIVSKICVLRRR